MSDDDVFWLDLFLVDLLWFLFLLLFLVVRVVAALVVDLCCLIFEYFLLGEAFPADALLHENASMIEKHQELVHNNRKRKSVKRCDVLW